MEKKLFSVIPRSYALHLNAFFDIISPKRKERIKYVYYRFISRCAFHANYTTILVLPKNEVVAFFFLFFFLHFFLFLVSS